MMMMMMMMMLNVCTMSVSRYTVMESDDDVLQFWAKAGRHQLPVLSQVAAVYLSMSSSSVPVECMFSTTGLIMNSKRCMLSADKLHRISVVHDNIKFCM